tara:strand:+ start:356 stop:559 length:204 start_codon:yes stop_codon:yes gene_type:complete
MIKTKFVTYDINELFELIMDFEEKLIVWADENITATWDVNVYIGEYEYIIEVLVKDDTDEKEEEKED